MDHDPHLNGEEATGEIWTYSTTVRAWLVLEQGREWRMTTLPPPLESLFQEINRALEAGLYYAAIAISLSIPDVCSWLTVDPDPTKLWSNRRRQTDNYKAWFDANLASRFNNLTADDCYSMRCGVLHNGQFGRPDARFDKIIFLLPSTDPQRGQIRLGGDILVTIAPGIAFGDVTGRVLQIEAVWFCRQFIDAARKWAFDAANNPHVAENLERLVRYRPDGLPPYMVGLPLIA